MVLRSKYDGRIANEICVFFSFSSLFDRNGAVGKFSVDDVISYLLVNRFYMAVKTTCT